MPRDGHFLRPEAPALPRWFPSAAQEARCDSSMIEEAPMRPFSPREDRALRAAAGKYGMIKVLAIALERAPAELYRRKARLDYLDKRRRS